LFHAKAEMPADLMAHTRYPEVLFAVQAEIYRAYHMTNPQSFYNKEDLWDLATYSSGQNGQPQPVTPTYAFSELPGSDTPEFVLMTSFTPRTKQNLIGRSELPLRQFQAANVKLKTEVRWAKEINEHYNQKKRRIYVVLKGT